MTPKPSKKQVRMLGTVSLVSAMVLVGTVAAQTSPADAIETLTSNFASQIADIGSAILGLYGLGQIIGLGFFSGDTSERMKKIGGSFGLVIILQSWGPINEWLTADARNVSSMVSVDPTQYMVDGMATISTHVADVAVATVSVVPV